MQLPLESSGIEHLELDGTQLDSPLLTIRESAGHQLKITLAHGVGSISGKLASFDAGPPKSIAITKERNGSIKADESYLLVVDHNGGFRMDGLASGTYIIASIPYGLSDDLSDAEWWKDHKPDEARVLVEAGKVTTVER